MSTWNVAAASVQGTSHIKRSQPCQDAHHWIVLDGTVLVAAVADGAGSVSLSSLGTAVVGAINVLFIAIAGFAVYCKPAS